MITLPDVQRVAELIADGKLEEVAYQSPAGPVTPLDMLYGYRPALARGHLFMAHKTGFSDKTLKLALERTGFAHIQVKRGDAFDLWAVGYKPGEERQSNIRPVEIAFSDPTSG